MFTVDPIRNPGKILAIKSNLKDKKEYRDYTLFTIGINSALRASDLLKLKISDVLDDQGNIKQYIYLRVQKTNRELKIRINKAMREAINYYMKGAKVFDPYQFLFKSKRSDKAIDNVALWYLIKKWTKAVGLKGERFSSQSLRKTWGYQARVYHGASIEMVSEKLGHRSTKVTKRYIGISQEEINKMEEEINI